MSESCVWQVSFTLDPSHREIQSRKMKRGRLRTNGDCNVDKFGVFLGVLLTQLHVGKQHANNTWVICCIFQLKSKTVDSRKTIDNAKTPCNNVIDSYTLLRTTEMWLGALQKSHVLNIFSRTKFPTSCAHYRKLSTDAKTYEMRDCFSRTKTQIVLNFERGVWIYYGNRGVWSQGCQKPL
jgi:hypothetical protein